MAAMKVWMEFHFAGRIGLGASIPEDKDDQGWQENWMLL
jgi:hypothetical protein